MTGGESESPETAVKDRAPRAEPVVSLPVGPWATVLVLLLAMAAYVDCLSYQFVWDDVLMLVQTQNLRDLRNLPQFLRTDFSTITSGAIEGGYYRPTLAMSLTLETKLWGLTPAPFHLTNLLLHVLATFLVSRLVLAMGGTSIAALFATLIFAIHPVHVEAVVWVAARQELLMTIGVLGCILSYQRWKVPGRWRALAGVAALLFLTLALLSKEPAVVLPALLVLSDVTAPSPRDPTQGPAVWRPALRRSLPFWFVTAVFAIFRLPTLRHIAGDQLHPEALWQRLPGALETLARYVEILLVPTRMSPIYALSRPASFFDPWAVFGLLLGAGLVFLLILWRHRLPLASFGIGWFLITVAPIMDLVPLSLREMGLTDRYLYLPSVGTSLLLALGIAGLIEAPPGPTCRLRNLVGWAAVVLILVSYPWSLLRYAPVWRSDLTLFTRMVETAPQSPSAQFNLGLAYLRGNDIPRATASLERAVRLDPALPRPRTILALLYVLRGRTFEGFRLFDAVASRGPRERDYYVCRAAAHLFAGQPLEALAVAEEGTHRFPLDAYLRYRKANALEAAGRIAEAREEYYRVVALRPDFFQALEALGNLLASSGQATEAARYFRQASEIHPDRVQPVRALALLAEGQGQRAEGLNYWRRVIELAPNGEAVREAVSHIRRLEREVGAPETAPLGSDPPGT